MPAGRPTVATPEMVEKAWQFVDGGWRRCKTARGTKMVYPMAEGLARYLGIALSTLYLREEFSEIVETLKVVQHEILADGGLTGDFDRTITKLILSSKHGYTENTDLTSGGEKLTQVVFTNGVPRPAAD